MYVLRIHLLDPSSYVFEKRSPERLIIPAIEKETRRKIWWGVYTLDRMLALALGRPIGAEDVDCDVELPIAFDDDFSLSTQRSVRNCRFTSMPWIRTLQSGWTIYLRYSSLR